MSSILYKPNTPLLNSEKYDLLYRLLLAPTKANNSPVIVSMTDCDYDLDIKATFNTHGKVSKLKVVS